MRAAALAQLLVFTIVCGWCLAQTGPVFDVDSPLGNRKGFSRNDQNFQDFVGSTSMEARRVKRNSKGSRILEHHQHNNSVTLESEDVTIDGRRRLQTVWPSILETLDLSSELEIFYDPPNNTFSECALGVFVRANKEDAKIYYEFEDVYTKIVADPTLDSAFLTFDSPYVHLNTPFGASRNRAVNLVIVWFNPMLQSLVRSPLLALRYVVEANARPESFGFLVPGVESSSYFLKFVIEMKAAARAQVAGGQEFADFYTELGVGTYQNQIIPMHLLDLHEDLNGFEGGFSVNCSSRVKHYGILVPFHNGHKFVGQVVRVDLKNFTHGPTCMSWYRREYLDGDGNIVVEGPADQDNACVHILDLTTLHPNARGFRRGFHQFPYAYLSPGEFNVPVRCDVCDFGLHSTKVIDLGLIDKRYGGYSGGFVDYLWSCFNPFRTFTGPFGGIRSQEPVDQGHLKPYFHAEMICIHADAWEGRGVFDDVPILDGTGAGAMASVYIEGRTVTSVVITDIGDGLYEAGDQISLDHSYFGVSTSETNLIITLVDGISIDDDLINLTHTVDSNPDDIEDANVKSSLRSFDLGNVDVELRGFSEAIRMGRFAYLSPLATQSHVYAGKLVRLFLGAVDIGETLDYLAASGGKIRDIVDVLDLKLLDSRHCGFSGIFKSGKFIYLVPYRNKEELYNGQRGHGQLVRVDANDFYPSGVLALDLEGTTRSQIPSFADEDLRGFSGGFASGKYGLIVPFYNAVFSGKVARFIAITDDMTGNVQELNLIVDRDNPGLYKGFRGGFVSLWQGFYDAV